MLATKAECSAQNSPRQEFQQRKEYKSIAMMNNVKMRMLRFDSIWNQIQTQMKKSRNNRRSILHIEFQYHDSTITNGS
jgi:hypothetical protein